MGRSTSEPGHHQPTALNVGSSPGRFTGRAPRQHPGSAGAQRSEPEPGTEGASRTPDGRDLHRWRDASAIALAAALLGWPLLFGRQLAADDIQAYLLQAQQTAENLRAGILMPAWAIDSNSGYGSPTLLFYPPVTHTVHALARALGMPLTSAVGWLAILALAASGWIVRGWLHAAGHADGAMPAALLYLAAPYRMIDLYPRSALAEHWAFLLPPALLWTLASALPRRRRICVLALLTASLVSTNLPQAVLMGLLVVGFVFSRLGRIDLAAASTGGVLGAGIASFVLVPAALAHQWTWSDLSYGVHAIAPPSAHTLFSAAGGSLNPVVSAAVVATALLGSIAYLIRRRERQAGASFWLGATLSMLLATTSLAGWLWDNTPILSNLQFPWRLAGPMTLACAALVSLVPGRRAWLLAIAATLLSLPLIGVGTVAPPARAELAPARPGTAFPLPQRVWEIAAAETGTGRSNPRLSDPWFLPRSTTPLMARELFADPVEQLANLRHRPAALRSGTPAELVRWERSGGEVRVRLGTTDTLTWHQLDFPGMECTVDGQPREHQTDPETGLISIDLPAGEHRVAWRWHPFSALRAARWTSLVALLVSLLLWLRDRPRGAHDG